MAVRDLEHGRVHLFQRIYALLELDVVGRELSLSCSISVLTPTLAMSSQYEEGAPCPRHCQPAP